MTGETVTAGRDVNAISDFDGTEPDAAVSDDAARERRIAVLRPYRWRPGQSGNPGGRMGKLAQRVREVTNNGEDLIMFLVRVMRDPKERTRDRLTAAHELADRGWGKAPAFVAIHRAEQLEAERERPARFPGLERMTPDDLRTFLRLLDIALGRSTPLALAREKK